MAQLTIGEALRARGLFVIVALGLLAMLYASQAQSVSDAERAMLLRQTLLQLVGAIAVVATLFLAAFTIPGDVESRRIFTLVTKPVSRGTVVVGRFLGVAVLALVLVALLGTMSAAVLTVSLSAADPADVAPRARVLPAETAFWGEGETRLTREAADGSRELLDPHHAGVLVRFRGLDRAAFDEEGPLLRLQTRLRMRPNRLVYPHERAEIAAAPMGASLEEVWRTHVTARTNEAIDVRVPWSAFAPESNGRGLQTEVALTVEGLPFSMVIAPDSVQLLGRTQSHATAMFAMLTVEAAKVLFVLAVVLLLACVFSPYTAILGGLVTVVAANLVAQLPSTVAAFATRLEHARLREYMESSMAVTLAIMGDPNANEVNAWTFVLAFAEIFPSFDRYPLTATYVAGVMPEPVYFAGASAYLLVWTVLLVALGAALFTMRDYP